MHLYVTSNNSQFHHDPKKESRSLGILVATHLGQVLARHDTESSCEKLREERKRPRKPSPKD